MKEGTEDSINLLNAIKPKVERPFSEKLAEAKHLAHVFARLPSACVSFSGGKDSMAVLHLVLQERPKIPVVFENTGIEFPETIRFVHKIAESYDLNFVELKPKPGVTFWTVNDRIRQECLVRDDGHKHSNLCCYHLKERPFQVYRKANNIGLSFTGVTAIESRHRMFVACMKGTEYFSYRDGYRKVHPLLYWRTKEVWDFVHDENLPINEAYCKYCLKRVGCMWCMSHRYWRQQVARLNPKIYAYMMRRYYGTPSLGEWQK